MHEGSHEILIKDALVFLIAAGLVVPALRMLKLPAVVGFILAGVALGPWGLGSFSDTWAPLGLFTIAEPEAAAPFAELGVLFLLFLLGLELSVEQLWSLRRIVFGAGIVQAAASAILLALMATVFDFDMTAAIIVGLALALSSTAVVMQMLTSSHQASAPVGRSALGVLLFQDILVAPILIFVGFASSDAGGNLGAVLLEAVVQGVLAVGILLVIGRFLLRHLFKMAADAGGRDFLMAITLLTVVGAAVLTASAGLSIALGAFLAGLMLGETEFKHQTEVDLDPFKGLLLGLFFMTVGLGLDLGVIAQKWPLVLAGLIVLLVIKYAIAWAAIRIFGRSAELATETAGLLAPAGEFAFVVLAAGVAGGVIGGEQATLVSAVAGLSMLLIPVTWRGSRILVGRMRSKGKGTTVPLPAEKAELEGHVIIAGFGRVGQAVARILDEEHTRVVALDSRPDTVARLRKQGWSVYFGDGARKEILKKAGLEGAAMVVVTLDDPKAAEHIVRAVRRFRPEIPILARAQDADHSRSLFEAGATHVVPDAIEAGLQMSARALEQFGYPPETVRSLIGAERDAEYRKAMLEQA
ncbi:MAG: cation:proton antiporter [Rhodobacterales bacterium]|nr:cation:proton antiporter [Rhodobacterales bacterium]